MNTNSIEYIDSIQLFMYEYIENVGDTAFYTAPLRNRELNISFFVEKFFLRLFFEFFIDTMKEYFNIQFFRNNVEI